MSLHAPQLWTILPVIGPQMSRGLPFPQHPSPSSCWEGEVDQQLTMVLELGPGGHHTHRGPRLPQNRVFASQSH